MFDELNITEDEKEILINSVSWITILIAGADGEIGKEELEWADKITGIRAYKYPPALENFYSTVGTDFQDRINGLIESLPSEAKERTAILTDKLSTLNPVLAKMNNSKAFSYYKSLTSFADHIAKSHGGFLRFFSVSTEEKKLINLPMIDPVKLEEAE